MVIARDNPEIIRVHRDIPHGPGTRFSESPLRLISQTAFPRSFSKKSRRKLCTAFLKKDKNNF